jgi:hypothetical protein
MSYMPTPITSADAQLRQSSIISQVYACAYANSAAAQG